jgi:hypothetical protein
MAAKLEPFKSRCCARPIGHGRCVVNEILLKTPGLVEGD